MVAGGGLMTGESFFSRAVPAWHGKGKVVGSDFSGSLADAFIMAGANYEVAKVPILLEAFGHRLTTDRFSLVRQPIDGMEDADGVARPAYFGEVGDDFEVIQNMEVAEILEPLQKLYPVETVGVLGKGETIFMSLRAGGSEIAGDAINEYFVCSNGLNGKKALRVDFTPVRVVCQNTLSSGLSAATVTAKITHKGTAKADLSFWSVMLPQLKLARAKTLETFAQLAETRITEEQATQIIEAAYPLPRASAKALLADQTELLEITDGAHLKTIADAQSLYGGSVARIEELREATHVLYEKYNDEFPQSAGTAWAAYNVVVEGADWFAPGRKTENSKRGESVLFGIHAKVKERGFKAAAALIV